MNRREFISRFSKYSLVAGTGAAANQVLGKSREISDQALLAANEKISAMSQRLDSIEDKQDKMMKALILTTALSTGIDLSLIL